MTKKWKDAYKQIALGSLLLLVLVIIPLIMVGRYAHPCADDFSYGYYPHVVFKETKSLSQTLHWAFYQVRATYDTWQGTFSSVFFMALSPAVWGEEFYFLTPLIMIFMIVFSHFYLLRKVIVGLLSGSKSIWIIVSSIVSFLMIETMVAPVEGIFWYNSAVHYVFMHSCMLLLLGTLVGMLYAKERGKKILLCVLACVTAIMCGGANYPTALLGIVCTAGVVGGMVWTKKRVIGIAPLAVYVVAFYLNVSAYGNKIRQENFTQTKPVEAVVNSFAELAACAGGWFTLQLLLFMILLIPFLWKLTETKECRFRLPAIVTLITICTNACMLTPGLYAMGEGGPGRTMNIVKMWFILMLVVNETYWMGYFRKRLTQRRWKKLPDIRLWTMGVLAVIFIAFIANAERCLLDYSSYAAYVSLKTGEAKQYHEEYMKRVELLTGESESVELLPFSQKPYLLYFDDITSNKGDWRNSLVANWYNKESVCLKGQD